jgi:hypothetical protein
LELSTSSLDRVAFHAAVNGFIKGISMTLPMNTKGAACCPYKALLTGCVAGLMVVALVGLGFGYLGSDLWAAFAGQHEEVASDQSLPVDAPTVTLVRCKDQEAAVTKAASGTTDNVVLLNDWTYTQSQSPFIFSSPGGFDFFNPLFAFDFFSGPIVNTTLPITPFGFNTTAFNTVPVITITPTTGGGVTVVTSNGTGGTNTTTTNGSTGTPVAFSNGASVFITITTASFVIPVPIGTNAISHRHGELAIFVSVTVIIINVSPSR